MRKIVASGLAIAGVVATMAMSSPAQAETARSAIAAGPYCEANESTDLHMAEVRCYNFTQKYYRLKEVVCSGSGRCETRYGDWKSMNSGAWSVRSDTYTWINSFEPQIGN